MGGDLDAKAFFVKPPTPDMITRAFEFLNECSPGAAVSA